MRCIMGLADMARDVVHKACGVKDRFTLGAPCMSCFSVNPASMGCMWCDCYSVHALMSFET